MSDLVERLRILHEEYAGGRWRRYQEVKDITVEAADRIEALEGGLKKANARERPAFRSGYWTGGGSLSESDVEQAWQQYRCQDDSDWKALKEDG